MSDAISVHKQLLAKKKEIETHLISVKAVLEQKQKEKAVFEAELKKEFGVDTPEELNKLRRDREEKIEQVIKNIEAQCPELCK